MLCIVIIMGQNCVYLVLAREHDRIEPTRSYYERAPPVPQRLTVIVPQPIESMSAEENV